MVSSSSSKTTNRPGALRTTRSFSRDTEDRNSSKGLTRPKRASTIQEVPEMAQNQKHGALGDDPSEARDVFDTQRTSEESMEPPRASVDLDNLPIELVSLTDSFIDSLSAKVHSAPPNIDRLSQLFQSFYATAATHIQTHIDSLASRQRRERSPQTPSSTRSSAASLLRAKAASIGNKDRPKELSRQGSEQQLLTAEEVADRKKARKALEQQRGLLEEAVERRLCEGIYNRIYRHRTTQDEEQDAMLRSKTAALSVVGIGPRDLGIDLGDSDSKTPEEDAARQEEVKESLEQARRELVLMNQSRYPLGKLNRLKAAHKAIIDTLAHFHPSSSADELMPMLIFTLITLPPEDLNVVSDMHFIQRFRWEQKMYGEAAYCLTTLEAAISFLETVDLSTLRADEAPSGPQKSSSGKDAETGSNKSETFPPAYAPGLSVPTPLTAETTAGLVAGLKPSASPSGLRAAVQLRNRRLSELVNTPALAIGAAGDAVFNSADQGLKNIGNSLGDSYKFLIGKLIEQKDVLTKPGSGEVLVPKTLDEARKLFGTPPPDEEGSIASGASSIHEDSKDRRLPVEDRVLNLISGRKVSSGRDHSADSARSAGSGAAAAPKKVVFAAEDPKDTKDNKSTAGGPGSSSPVSAPNNPALIDSMRNLGNQLNPMSRLSGFRGFGRTVSTPAPATSMTMAKDKDKGSAVEGEVKDLATALPDIASSLPPKPEVPKIRPPIKRFVEMQNPGDLRIGEVLELLRDYRRLAGALKERDAFKE